MSHITDQIIDQTLQEKTKNFSFLQVIALIGMVLLAALFIGNMLFGKNSLEVYWTLEKQQMILDKKISDLSNQNASLQKKYFELKSLMPEENLKEPYE